MVYTSTFVWSSLRLPSIASPIELVSGTFLSIAIISLTDTSEEFYLKKKLPTTTAMATAGMPKPHHSVFYPDQQRWSNKVLHFTNFKGENVFYSPKLQVIRILPPNFLKCTNRSPNI